MAKRMRDRHLRNSYSKTMQAVWANSGSVGSERSQSHQSREGGRKRLLPTCWWELCSEVSRWWSLLQDRIRQGESLHVSAAGDAVQSGLWRHPWWCHRDLRAAVSTPDEIAQPPRVQCLRCGLSHAWGQATAPTVEWWAMKTFRSSLLMPLGPLRTWFWNKVVPESGEEEEKDKSYQSKRSKKIKRLRNDPNHWQGLEWLVMKSDSKCGRWHRNIIRTNTISRKQHLMLVWLLKNQIFRQRKTSGKRHTYQEFCGEKIRKIPNDYWTSSSNRIKVKLLRIIKYMQPVEWKPGEAVEFRKGEAFDQRHQNTSTYSITSTGKRNVTT